MRSDTLQFGLAVLAGLGAAQAQDVIEDDTYFYGLSPAVYPSRTLSLRVLLLTLFGSDADTVLIENASGTGNWSSAFSKAKAFVAQLTLEEKVNGLCSDMGNIKVRLLTSAGQLDSRHHAHNRVLRGYTSHSEAGLSRSLPD